jgi:uncharacterized membrane protein
MNQTVPSQPSKADAQARADEIAVFRRELVRLQDEGALTLDEAQRATLAAHHDALLADLARQFDIDRSAPARQLSLGMRVASFLGALALAASVYFLFHQFWGHFGEATQVGILIAAALGSFAGTLALKARDGSGYGYFTKLAALVAFACFVLNIAMVGQIFNLTPSDKALLPWAAYAFLLAYLCDLRLLLAAGILCTSAWIAARVGTWSGLYWLSVGERPENFFPAALFFLALPQLIDHRRFTGFAPVYRVFGLLLAFVPILVLANWGEVSYLPGSAGLIEGIYQLAGFALAAGAIWLGARRDLNEVVNTGISFFVIFLYTKFFDWWWDALPKYLFFLILGATAVAILVVLRRLRARQSGKGAA